MSRALLGLLAIAVSQSFAATITVPLKGLRAATLDGTKEYAYAVTDKSKVAVVNLSTGKLEGEVAGISNAATVTSGTNEILVLSSISDGKPAVLHRIDAKTRKLTDSKTLEGVIEAPRNIFLVTDDRLLLFTDSRSGSHVVSLKEGRSLSKFQAIKGLLYATPGIAMNGDIALLPGAYPGEIVSLDVKAAKPAPIGSVAVPDWIHDVKIVDKDHVITAGHLDGVQLVSLVEKDEHNRQKAVTLTKSRHAHVLVEGNNVVATSIDKVETIDLKAKAVTSLAMPKIGDVNENRIGAIPLGRDKEGRLVIAVEGAGVVAL